MLKEAAWMMLAFTFGIVQGVAAVLGVGLLVLGGKTLLAVTLVAGAGVLLMVRVLVFSRRHCQIPSATRQAVRERMMVP